MLDFTFRSVISFELILVWCQVWMEFNVFQMDIKLFPHHFLKRLSFLH